MIPVPVAVEYSQPCRISAQRERAPSGYPTYLRCCSPTLNASERHTTINVTAKDAFQDASSFQCVLVPMRLGSMGVGISVGALVRRPANPRRRFSRGPRERKISRCDGKCCTRKSALQSLARRERFEPSSSCVYRQDRTAAQWKFEYASPDTCNQR